MTILHVIAPHRLDDALVKKVVAACRADQGETLHVLCLFPGQDSTDNDLTTEHLPGLYALTLRDRWLSVLYRYMPDVVQLHGNDDNATAHIAQWSAQRNFTVQRQRHLPTVTLKKNGNFVRLRLPRLLLYTPRVNKCLNKKQRSTQITKRILHTLLLLLKKYYDGDDYAFDDDDNQLLSTLSNSDWHTIAEIIRHQQLPSLASLLPAQYALLSTFASQQQQAPSTPRPKKPGLLPQQLLQLKTDISAESVTLQQLGECYHTLHTLDEDEIQLTAEIKKQGCITFLKDMETVLSEMFGLTEGYMLVRPRNTLATNAIRKHIFNAITQQDTTLSPTR